MVSSRAAKLSLSPKGDNKTEKSSNGFRKAANKEQVRPPTPEEGDKQDQEKAKASEVTVSCEHQNARDTQESHDGAEENGTTSWHHSLKLSDDNPYLIFRIQLT